MGAQYLYFTIALGNLGGFVAATVMGWSSPMLERLQGLDDNPLGRAITEDEMSLLASLSLLGSCLACISLSIFGSMFGRKTLLVSQGVVVLASYLIMAWTKTAWLLLACRFMTGFGVGGVLTVLPIYFGELAEAKNRGMISTSFVTAMNAGMLFSYSTGPYLSYFLFHIMLATFSAIYVGMFFVFAPESPYFIIKSDREKAGKVLRKLQGDENLEDSLDQMEETLRHSSKVSFMEIFKSKASVKTLIIGIGGFTFSQLTGGSIFLAFTQTFLKEAGDPHPDIGPILINIIQFVVSILASFFADRFPRKTLLMFSFAGTALSQLLLGIYFHLQLNNYEGIEKISFIPIVCLISLASLNSIGLAPVLMTFLGELFPQKIKSVVVSFLVAYNLAGMFVINLIYNNVKDAIHMDNLIWIFAACAFTAVFFVKIFIVETRGKTLQEIQDEMNSRHD